MNGLIGSTDPFPYIFTAYTIGAICTLGVSVWLYMARLRVERHLKILKGDSHS
jgi:hypothetical protein